jgi:hypothetical protein
MLADETVARTHAMTVGELLDLMDPDKEEDGYREVQKLLPLILYWAAGYYSCIEAFQNGHWAACWRALELAALLVRADDIVEEDAKDCVAANEIIDWLALVALFVNENRDGLKSETRAYLKQISDLLERAEA